MNATCKGLVFFLVRPYIKNVNIFCRFAASVVTSVTYGRRVESVDEWIVKENMESMDCRFLEDICTFQLIIQPVKRSY